MPNTRLPETVAEFVKNKDGSRDPITGKMNKRARGIDNIRATEAKRLARVLKLRFVDNLNYPDISKLTGLGVQVIRTMIDPFKVIMENPEQIRQFKKFEPHILDGVRMLMVQGMVDQLTDEKRRKKMDLSRLTYGFGILYDKQRLERGESTANVMSLSELVRAAHSTDVTEVEMDRDGIIAEIETEGALATDLDAFGCEDMRSAEGKAEDDTDAG
jgi:hypothetical protein